MAGKKKAQHQRGTGERASAEQGLGEAPLAVLVPAAVRSGHDLIPLLGRTYTVGRGGESDILLPDEEASISRDHARLSWSDGAHFLDDAGSTYGTRVNGTPVAPGAAVRLAEGDLIEFASSVYTYRRLGAEDSGGDRRSTWASPLESLDPAEVVRRGLEALRQISWAYRSLLVGHAEEPALEGLLTPLDDPELRVSRSLINEALHHRRTVARFVGSSGAIDPTQSMDQLQLSLVWIHPLLAPNGPPTVVAYLDSPEQAEPFSPRVERRLKEVCAQIALALRNAVLHWELLQLNRSLEARVEERTQALEASQARLLAQDRHATLGRLVAGIAHELNNPAAAIDSFSQTLNELLPRMVAVESELTRLLVEPSKQATLRRRIDELLGPARRPADSMARRELSARWARRLGEGGASDSESLADKLATTGLEPGTLELDDVLLGPHRASVVDLLERVATFRTGVETQRECAAAIARIVSGLKTYAHLDAPEAERGDIHKGIEVALAVMAPRIPAGVEVVTRFGECRPIVHHPGALMQVWTNLLDNALRAMGDSGRLKIETTQASDMVVVSISDTGPGIPVELRDHIFELDVTTRGPGAGLGLGLPICKRIIKADHGGQITFETGAAGTTFEVRLPERG